MKQSWQNNIDTAFKYNVSVNRHVAKDMLDEIIHLEAKNKKLKSQLKATKDMRAGESVVNTKLFKHIADRCQGAE